MSVHRVEITTENLLSAVVQMTADDFERFFQDAKRLKKREVNLIAKLDKFNLSAEDEKIYRDLLRKFRAEKITEMEHKLLISLTEELEDLNVERMKCLVEISQIRKKSLREVMKELDIKPKNYD